MRSPLARGQRLVPRMAAVEALATLLAAIGFLAASGVGSATAALVGGATVVAGTLVFGWRMFAAGVGNPATAISAMALGKLMQWITLALGLFLALGVWQLPAVPVVSGVVAAYLGFWIAIAFFR